MKDPALRRALDAYKGASRGDRFHVWVRAHSCPFAAVEAAVPRQGRVLDLGCGHGLFSRYLKLSSPARDVTGTDIDRDKIEVARAAAGPPVTFEAVAPASGLDGSWDAITIVDVLYLLGTKAAGQVLDTAAAALAPGGVLVIKETDVVPSWKYRLTRFQEVLATKVLRITEGSSVDFLPPDDIEARLAAAGLDVERQRVDRRSIHPHHLIVGRWYDAA